MSKTSTLEPVDTHTGRKLQWRRWLVYLTIFTVVLYLLSLALLNTSWAKNKLISKLQKKSHSSWEIGSIQWLPFGDIQLNNLHTQMGKGGIQISSLSVTPSWRGLFSGKLKMNEVTAKEADLDIDLQWLKANSLKNKPSPHVEHASAPQAKKPHNQAKKPKPSNQKPKNKPKIKPQVKVKPVVVEEPKVDTTPNHWLKIEKLNITLRNGEKLIKQLNDVTASIPYYGKPNSGKVQFKFQGEEYQHEIIWDGATLKATEANGKLFNVKYQWSAACKVNQLGMPFQLVLDMPQQPLDYIYNAPNIHVRLQSKRADSKFTLGGRLNQLNSWKGIFNANAENLTITENQKTHKSLHFDQAGLVGVVANGVISVPRAEAIGYNTSILANGCIHKNLYTYGVARIIIDENYPSFFDRVYDATRLIHIDENRRHFFSPLETPDRRYCDLYLDGSLTDIEIMHNRSNQWQSLNAVIKKLLKFKDSELDEDGLLEPSN